MRLVMFNSSNIPLINSGILVMIQRIITIGFNSFVVALLLYSQLFSILQFLVINMWNLIMDMPPFYIGNSIVGNGFLFLEVFIFIFIFLCYCNRRFSWCAIYGYCFCLLASIYLLSFIFLLIVWYVNSSFANEMSSFASGEMDLAAHFYIISFYSIVGLLLIKKRHFLSLILVCISALLLFIIGWAMSY